MFTSEEPTRFKLSCVGSRAMSGALTADVLDVKLDENGTSFREVRQAVVAGCVATLTAHTSTHTCAHSYGMSRLPLFNVSTSAAQCVP